MSHPGVAAQWREWHADLLDPALIHADASGCSARSRLVTDAVKEHLDLEARVGAYVAEEMVTERIEGGRAGLARLAGGGRVAFAQNASQAFRWLISVWPLPANATIGMLPSEYPANRVSLETTAHLHGFELVRLPTDPLGRLDLEGAERMLPGLELVAFPHIPSHRGIVQPVEELAALCKTQGVDLILDAAQSFGQRDVSGIHPSAFVGTSRKWLQGPRGVGFVVVADDRIELEGPAGPEEGDAGVAERVGLAAAVGELERRGAGAVQERVAELSRHLRTGLSELAKWELIEPLDEVSGSTTLRHPDHDPAAILIQLREGGIVATVIPVERAPDEIDEPLLRFSLHGYADESWIERIIDEMPA